jgi:hypothetical protein
VNPIYFSLLAPKTSNAIDSSRVTSRGASAGTPWLTRGRRTIGLVALGFAMLSGSAVAEHVSFTNIAADSTMNLNF